VTVVQVSKHVVVQRNPANGRVDTAIGCVDTGRAELNVVVSGDEIDLSLASRLEAEETALAAVNALTGHQAHSYITLDAADARGLIALLRQAMEVRARGLSTPDQTRFDGYG
jgi:hypothetical protein